MAVRQNPVTLVDSGSNEQTRYLKYRESDASMADLQILFQDRRTHTHTEISESGDIIPL